MYVGYSCMQHCYDWIVCRCATHTMSDNATYMTYGDNTVCVSSSDVGYGARYGYWAVGVRRVYGTGMHLLCMHAVIMLSRDLRVLLGVACLHVCMLCVLSVGYRMQDRRYVRRSCGCWILPRNVRRHCTSSAMRRLPMSMRLICMERLLSC